MEEKYVTMEQIIAGAIFTFGSISKSKLDFILKSFELYMKDFVVADYITKLSEYITYEDEVIKIKEDYLYNSSFYEYLKVLAGEYVLNFYTFITKKGCVNCYNQDCLLTIEERNEVSKFNYLVGNDCLDYYNEPLVDSILKRTRKAE